MTSRRSRRKLAPHLAAIAVLGMSACQPALEIGESTTTSPETTAPETTTTTTSPGTTTTTIADPGYSHAWVVGYYPWYETSMTPPTDFPYSTVSHTVVGNVKVVNGLCCAESNAGAMAYATEVVTLAHAAHTQVLLLVGGSDDPPGGWIAGTQTPTATTTLARSIVDYAKALGVDGVDLDWEQEVDLVAEGRLAVEIRRLWPESKIMMALSPFDASYTWAPEVLASVDRFNLMNYVSVGNWGGWDGPWHQGALFGDGPGHPLSVDRSVKRLIASGVPAAKVGIGIGLFGSAYGDSNSDGDCPSAPSSGWHGEWGAWFADSQLTLKDIDELYAPHMAETFDGITNTPYLSAPAPGAGGTAGGWPPKLCYITFENPRSAEAKANYVTSNGLGGVIAWAVPQDRRTDGSYPVMEALKRTFR